MSSSQYIESLTARKNFSGSPDSSWNLGNLYLDKDVELSSRRKINMAKKAFNSKTSHEIRQWLKFAEKYGPIAIRWSRDAAISLKNKFSKPNKIDLSGIDDIKRSHRG